VFSGFVSIEAITCSDIRIAFVIIGLVTAMKDLANVLLVNAGTSNSTPGLSHYRHVNESYSTHPYSGLHMQSTKIIPASLSQGNMLKNLTIVV
jgi:hypothetical protein